MNCAASSCHCTAGRRPSRFYPNPRNPLRFALMMRYYMGMADDSQVMVSRSTRIEIVLHEYDNLYGLVTFRMASLDRRAPIGAATLVASLGVVGVLPPVTQHVFLVAVPLALIWFLRTSINHARSFEDVLSRLAEIERFVNEKAGVELLAFQSRHPSRRTAMGGRTGRETVLSVYTICLVFLASNGYLAYQWTSRHTLTVWCYWTLLGLEAVYLTHCLYRLRAYRYHKPMHI